MSRSRLVLIWTTDYWVGGAEFPLIVADLFILLLFEHRLLLCLDCADFEFTLLVGLDLLLFLEILLSWLLGR